MIDVVGVPLACAVEMVTASDRRSFSLGPEYERHLYRRTRNSGADTQPHDDRPGGHAGSSPDGCGGLGGGTAAELASPRTGSETEHPER